MSQFQAARKNMVDCQIHTSGVVNYKILDAFKTIPREIFVAPEKQHVAYTDGVIPINKERFLLNPMAHARLLQAIDPQADEVALDIGSGTGYSAAILSTLVSTVIAVENRQNTIDKATQILNSIDVCNVAFFKEKLNEGYAKHAPYNIILFNGALGAVPDHILDQLAPGGRLAAIIQPDASKIGHAVLIMKSKTGNISQRTLFEISLPYLQGFEPKTEFAF